MNKPMPTGMFDDQIGEIMKLVDEHPELFVHETAEEAAQRPSKEALMQDLTQASQGTVLTGEDAALVEHSIMMSQWDALVADYERREAEERAAADGDTDGHAG